MIINPIQFDEIQIPFDKVLARLGYAKGKTKLDDALKNNINEEIDFSRKLLYPKQVIASSNIFKKYGSQIHLRPNLTIKSKKIYSLLKNCSLCYGFAVTIGPYLEEKRNQYTKENKTTKALIIDAIGSVAAEELAEIVNSEIKKEVKKNKLKTTLRFSPGYGDWELPSQKDFLAWLGAEKIGIKLTDKFQMLPEKSVSAILGVYK